MLKLPKITLTAFGSTNVEGMKKAIDASCKGIEWGDVKLITEVKCNNIDQWNYHMVYTLGEFIKTPFAMVIHPDGYVVHPESWWDGFMEYDFIGAPWPLPTDSYSYLDPDGKLIRVGNSVSLRSWRLMNLPKVLGLEWRAYYGNTHEDGFICCHNRKILEANGCKFAPIEVAKYFSKERDIPENADVEKPFAFHKRAEYEMFE